MASGRLGAVDLAAATNTLVYQYTGSTTATVNIHICDRNTAKDSLVRIAHVNAGVVVDLAAEDYIVYDSSVIIEKTGIVMGVNDSIVAYSDNANVSIVITGFED